MRIIALGDIHMAADGCRNIPHIQEADLVIVTGDLTNYGSRSDAKKVLDQLMGFNQNILALLGNLDNFEINDYLEQLDLNLHGQARLVQGKICFIGVGGSGKTPFNTPTEFTESEITRIVTRGYSQGKGFIELSQPLNKCRIPLVLISHTPPAVTQVDRLANGRHVGSMAVREFIEKHQPDLCICGHIHEAKGEDTIGKTHIINPGMLQQGGWVDIQLKNSTLHATLQ